LAQIPANDVKSVGCLKRGRDELTILATSRTTWSAGGRMPACCACRSCTGYCGSNGAFAASWGSTAESRASIGRLFRQAHCRAAHLGTEKPARDPRRPHSYHNAATHCYPPFHGARGPV